MAITKGRRKPRCKNVEGQAQKSTEVMQVAQRKISNEPQGFVNVQMEPMLFKLFVAFLQSL